MNNLLTPLFPATIYVLGNEFHASALTRSQSLPVGIFTANLKRGDWNEKKKWSVCMSEQATIRDRSFITSPGGGEGGRSFSKKSHCMEIVPPPQ